MKAELAALLVVAGLGVASAPASARLLLSPSEIPGATPPDPVHVPIVPSDRSTSPTVFGPQLAPRWPVIGFGPPPLPPPPSTPAPTQPINLVGAGIVTDDPPGGGTIFVAPNSPIPSDPLLLASPVPEPSTWAMLLAGFAALGALALRRPVSSAKRA